MNQLDVLHELKVLAGVLLPFVICGYIASWVQRQGRRQGVDRSSAYRRSSIRSVRPGRDLTDSAQRAELIGLRQRYMADEDEPRPRRSGRARD